MSATIGNVILVSPAGPTATPPPNQGEPADSPADRIGGQSFVASLQSIADRITEAREDDQSPNFVLPGVDMGRRPELLTLRQPGGTPPESDPLSDRPQDEALFFPKARLDAAQPTPKLKKIGAEPVEEVSAALEKIDAHAHYQAANADAPVVGTDRNGAAFSAPEADVVRPSAQGGGTGGGEEIFPTRSKADSELLVAATAVSSEASASDASKISVALNNNANTSAPNLVSDFAAGAPAAPVTIEAAPAETRPSATTNPAQHLVASSSGAQHLAVNAIIRQTDNVIEVRLDPPELGKITIEFSDLGSAGIRATVSADLPGTLDFLRRHADQLTLELERHGVSGSDLSFSDRGAGESAQFDKKRAMSHAVGIVAAESTPVEAAIEAVLTTAYDRIV